MSQAAAAALACKAALLRALPRPVQELWPCVGVAAAARACDEAALAQGAAWRCRKTSAWGSCLRPGEMLEPARAAAGVRARAPGVLQAVAHLRC